MPTKLTHNAYALHPCIRAVRDFVHSGTVQRKTEVVYVLHLHAIGLPGRHVQEALGDEARGHARPSEESTAMASGLRPRGQKNARTGTPRAIPPSKPIAPAEPPHPTHGPRQHGQTATGSRERELGWCSRHLLTEV